MGNRLSKTDPAGAVSYSYDAADRLVSGAGTAPDADFYSTYDSNGNLVGRAEGGITRAFVYDSQDRLIEVKEGTDSIAAYAYDANGRRVAKTASGQTTRFLYDGQQILAEYTPGGALKGRFIHGPGIDEPLLMVRGGKFSYFHPDGLGSVTALTDARGVLQEAYRYRAFGEVAITDAVGRQFLQSRLQNPFLFTGREWDSETGLYHYGRRSYDPSVGRSNAPHCRWDFSVDADGALTDNLVAYWKLEDEATRGRNSGWRLRKVPETYGQEGITPSPFAFANRKPASTIFSASPFCRISGGT